MVANRMDPPRPGGEPAKPNPGAAPESAPKEAPAPAPSGGGVASWLPLIISLVAMPLLAYATTTFILVPKWEQAAGKNAVEPGKPAAKAGKKAGAEAVVVAKQVTVPLKKVLVNVAGTQGTRYLLANITVVGPNEEFKSLVNEHLDQLVDLACGLLASKTINDLEKPGSRNEIRTELLTAFNHALAESPVQELYFTDFAIQ
jgi:flagellar FliL protein